LRFSLKSLGSVTEWQSDKTTDGKRLGTDAARVAAALAERGIGPGDKVLIYHGGSARFFADLFGVWRVGACAACLNPGLTGEELHNITALLSPSLLLVTGKARVPEDLGVPVLNSADIEDGAALAETTDLHGHQDDEALILFTSGTTGTPKGVVHTFRSLLARIALNQAYIPDAAMARTLCVLPTHFGHGLIGNCLTPLLAGHDLVLAPGTNLEVTGALGKLIDDHGITFMSSVPTLWKKVVKTAAPPSRGTLVRVQVGSAPLSAELWSNIVKWSGIDDVVNMYGITETANWLAGASSAEFEPEDGLIGHMWGGTAAVLTNEGNIELQGTGELLVQSPSLLKEYYRLPEITAAVLRDGWFHTGDVGRIDADGSIRLVGRAKYEINRGGLKVHPEDIDLLLERHEEVREACAFAIPDETEGETIGVAVSLIDGADADARSLRRWCTERLSREKVPVKWFLIEEIPKTDRGKMNRDNVARHCLSGETNTEKG
jgi:acyl-CoA synthetase (AMP-forming)/AMP-acid ligase II